MLVGVGSFGIMEMGPPPARAGVRELSSGQVMGWLFVAGSAFWSRAIVLSFWMFGSQLGRAFDSWVVPVIGFVLVPWTTVAYAFMWGISSDKVAGVEWLVVAGALTLDLVTWLETRRLSR